MAGMRNLPKASITIDAPPEKVWAIVAHRFDEIGEWSSVIPNSAAIDSPSIAQNNGGAPIGARACESTLPGISNIEETIIAYDEKVRRLTYRATAGVPAFMKSAANTWTVADSGQGKSKVTIEPVVEVGALGRWLLLPIRPMLIRSGKQILEDLKHYAETDRPSPRKQRQLGDLEKGSE